MARYIGCPALLFVLVFPVSAFANFGFFHAPAATVHYYAVPVYYVPVPRVYAVAPVCVAPVPVPVPIFAAPTPAGPSTPPPPPASMPASPGTPAVPVVPGSAGVSESRYFDAYTIVPNSSARVTANRCSVSFWNLADRDLTVRVGGQDRLLPRGKSLMLDLDRQFDWQVLGRELQAGRVATADAGMEIVIRR